MAEKKGVKASDINAKIKEHEENLNKVNEEIQQIVQAHNQRVQQKTALEGAIAGLREFVPGEEVAKEEEAKA
jgi:hypothetical protein